MKTKNWLVVAALTLSTTSGALANKVDAAFKKHNIRMADTLLLAEVADKGLPFSPHDFDGESTKILVVGDTGTGDETQYTIARGMEHVCQSRGCQFSLMAGDNIYESGASSADDQQFLSKFEAPYKHLDFEFIAALGNHDVMPGEDGVRAQIDYTQRSSKWTMSDRYYHLRRQDVDLFVIDSNTFHRESAQRTWLEQGLQASDAKWKIVMGHHSPHSVGRHKLSDPFEGSILKKLDHTLTPLLCRYADIYVGGHDHHLQVNESACGVVSLLSGAASKSREIYPELIRDHRQDIRFAKGEQYGFMHLELKPSTIQVQVFDESGNILYNMEFPKRAS